MKYIQTLILLALATWLGSCSSARVQADADPIVNLSRYKTFRFTDARQDSLPLYRTVLEDELHRTIALELAKRGIVEDNHGAALLVVYHTFTEQKQGSINNYYPMMYGGWSWRMYPWKFTPYPFGHRIGYNHAAEYTEGTLIIDVIDTKSNMLIWRGSLADAVVSPDDVNKKAVKAVSEILKEFPVAEQKTPVSLRDPRVVARD
jgi:hypothetical protein